jgi:hypothetical protein
MAGDSNLQFTSCRILESVKRLMSIFFFVHDVDRSDTHVSRTFFIDKCALVDKRYTGDLRKIIQQSTLMDKSKLSKLLLLPANYASVS